MASSALSNLRMRRRYAGVLLFLLPVPLLLKAIGGLWAGHLVQLAANGISFGLFVLGAMLVRSGLQREALYLERPLASRRPPPLKTIGAVVVGLATAAAAHLAAQYDAAIAVLFGLGAAAGVFLTYGPDPKRHTMISGEHGVGAAELTAALQEAYAKLDGINAARAGIRSREFQERLKSIIGESEAILKEIEADPRDLRRARKFLNVYLDGVLGVTEKYARAAAKGGSAELEQNYRALLMDMETVCKEQHQKLQQNDFVDLDIQIEVLSTRLKREGVV